MCDKHHTSNKVIQEMLTNTAPETGRYVEYQTHITPPTGWYVGYITYCIYIPPSTGWYVGYMSIIQCCGSRHFCTDPDPAFPFDTDQHPTVWSGSGSLSFKKGNVPKQYFLHILTWFSLSVGPTGPNQKAYFVKFSLPVNFVVLIKVAYVSGSRS